MQVPGVLLAACRAMSVTRVGSGRVGAPRSNRQGAAIAQPVPGTLAWLRDTTTGTAEHAPATAVARHRHAADPGPATAVAWPSARHHHRAVCPGASDRVRARSFRQSKSIGE